MSTEIIEVIGRYIEVEPGVFEWQGHVPDPQVRLWRPAGRYHLLDGTIADQPRLSIPISPSDDEVVGAAAVGALLTFDGFMAAWQGLTGTQRRSASRMAGEAACRTLAALSRGKRRQPRKPNDRTPREPGSNAPV